MVIGLDIFRKYFEPFPGNYIIIGGTECDIIIDEAGFTPRATKDIDIILVVETLGSKFVQQNSSICTPKKCLTGKNGN